LNWSIVAPVLFISIIKPPFRYNKKHPKIECLYAIIYLPSRKRLATKYEERCTACCQTIADTFQELLEALIELARLDLSVKEKCSEDASRLAEYMVERLKEWPPVPTTNMTTVETYAPHERW